VDEATGALTVIAGSPYTSGDNAAAVAVDPTSQFAYVANTDESTVSAFEIDEDTGALTAVSGSPFATDPAPVSVAVDPSGKYLFVANYWGDSLTAYSIDTSTGALKELSGSPYVLADGAHPSAVIAIRIEK
jgi:6-phosphogluconolactonase